MAASNFPDCPYLPQPRADLDWRALHAYRDGPRGDEFYYHCLEYGHFLWHRGLAARALLCLDRAFGAELKGNEKNLVAWPMPYAPTAWILQKCPGEVFLGNPRVHFQHYAGRMNEPRREQRRWRAWACWALARTVCPHLGGDPLHEIDEPSPDDIYTQLTRHALPGEAVLWQDVLKQYSI